MKFHQLFNAAIYEPKKLAAFRLLPIGKVFKYVFIFISLFTLISFIRFIAGDAALFESFARINRTWGNNRMAYLSDCISYCNLSSALFIFLSELVFLLIWESHC